jgi:hypothetical protein
MSIPVVDGGLVWPAGVAITPDGGISISWPDGRPDVPVALIQGAPAPFSGILQSPLRTEVDIAKLRVLQASEKQERADLAAAQAAGWSTPALLVATGVGVFVGVILGGVVVKHL